MGVGDTGRKIQDMGGQSWSVSDLGRPSTGYIGDFIDKDEYHHCFTCQIGSVY